MAAPSAGDPRPASTLAIGLALMAVYLIWGSTYLGIRFALEGGWPPLLAVSGGRMLWPVRCCTRCCAGAACADAQAVAVAGGDGPADDAARQRHGGIGRRGRVVRSCGHRDRVDAAVDGSVRRHVRPSSESRRMARHRHRFHRRALAQRRQQSVVDAARPDPAVDRTDRLGVRLGVVARPRSAVAIHGRRHADALRRGDADRARSGGGRHLPRPRRRRRAQRR